MNRRMSIDIKASPNVCCVLRYTTVRSSSSCVMLTIHRSASMSMGAGMCVLRFEQFPRTLNTPNSNSVYSICCGLDFRGKLMITILDIF